MRKSMVLVGGGALAGVGYFSLQDPESALYSAVVMPAMHLLDPETAHKLSVQFAANRLSPVDKNPDDPTLHIHLWGKHFRNPIGLAAGFDKNAETMEAMLSMGFGFVEVGSILPRPQPGNPKPRLFRLKHEGAIINRYGFNSEGMEAARKRLREFRRDQHQLVAMGWPPHYTNALESIRDSYLPGYLERKQARQVAITQGIVGVNIGKNKDSVVPLQVIGEDGKPVLDDYSIVAQNLGAYADYLVVNVSSPNTPNLRDLQGAKELTAILTRLQRVRDSIVLADPKPPILIKIAPDLTHEQAADIAKVALDMKVDGIIVSNTTVSRPPCLLDTEEARVLCYEAGGLSGRPLKDKSTKLLGEMYKLTDGRIPLIGVGGIETGKDAYDKIRAGASLVQLYSSMALEGPPVVPRIKRELAEILKANNYQSVQQAIGSAHTQSTVKI